MPCLGKYSIIIEISERKLRLRNSLDLQEVNLIAKKDAQLLIVKIQDSLIDTLLERSCKDQLSNYHAVQTGYTIKYDNEPCDPLSIHYAKVGTLIDNDYMFADHIAITLFKTSKIENCTLEIFYDVYHLRDIQSIDRMPGKFVIPFFKTPSLFDNEVINANFGHEYVIENFLLQVASKGAAGVDVKMLTLTQGGDEKNISELRIFPKSTITIVFKQPLTSALDLIGTPNFIMLRSRFIWRRLKISHFIKDKLHLAVIIINDSDEKVDILDDDRRLFQIHLPDFLRTAIYARFQKDEAKKATTLRELMNMKFEDQITDEVTANINMAKITKAYEDVLGAEINFIPKNRKSKIDKQYLPF